MNTPTPASPVTAAPAAAPLAPPAPAQPATSNQQPATRPAYTPAIRKAFPPRIATTLTRGVDISAMLADPTPNRQINLTGGPSVIYTVHGSPTVTAANLTVLGDGCQLVISPVQGHSSGIANKSDGFEIGKLSVRTPFFATIVFQNYGTNFHCHDLAMPEEFSAFLINNLGAAWVLAENCIATLKHGDYFVFSQADDVTIRNCETPGSMGQPCVRWSGDDASGYKPVRGWIEGCDLANYSPLNKECVAVRDGQVIIKSNRIRNYCRVGQVTGANHAQVVFDGNTFDPDSRADQICIEAGVDAWIDDNIFNTQTWQRGVGYNANTSTIHSANNNTLSAPSSASGQKLKALILRGPAQVEEFGTGTKVVYQA